jgi:MFS family permease
MTKAISLSRIMPLYVVIFFGFVGYSMMITLFTPLFMYAERGIVPLRSSIEYRVIVLGVVLALYPFAQFFGSPILGALSDRFGRKPILVTTLYVAPICYALIAISLTISSLTLLMIGSFFAGLSQANMVISQSAIADIASHEHRGRLFGYTYLSSSLAYVVGPLLAGKCGNDVVPFWIVFGCLIATLIWTKIAFKETKLEKEFHIRTHHAFLNLLTIFTAKNLRPIYFVNFLLYFSIFGFFRCYPMYIVDAFHVNVSHLSEFIAWVAIPIILVNLGITGALSKRFSPRFLTFWSALFTGIFMFSIVGPSSVNALWVTLFLTSAGLALALPSSATMLSLAASPSEQGRVMGNNQALLVAAESSSAFIGGLLAAIAINLSLIVLACIACATAGLILWKRFI